MLKPISINVIRQAVEWSGLPDPLSIRQLSAYKWPNGDISGEYVLTFEGSDVRREFEYEALYDGSAADSKMRYALNECFCTDITVVRTWCHAYDDTWKAEVYGRLKAHPGDWQPPLFDDVFDAVEDYLEQTELENRGYNENV